MNLILLLVGLVIGAVAGWFGYKCINVKTLEDLAPEIENTKNNVLKLQNELSKYVKVEDGKVKITIVK